MIKIDFPRIGVDGISRTEIQILTWFVHSITKKEYEGTDKRIIADLKNNKYSSPYGDLDNIIKINDKKNVLFVLHKIKANLLFILKMKPNEIEDFIVKNKTKLTKIVDFDANAYSDKGKIVIDKLGKTLLTCLKYSVYRNSLLVKLADFLNIRSCPYCNAAYTLYIEGKERKYEENNNFSESMKKRALFQFDHYFPKEQYPIFSISFYNLIPSCSCCNLKKSKTEIKYPLKFHPYLGSVSDHFHFKMNEASSLSFWKGGIPEKFDLRMIANKLKDQPCIDKYNHQYNIILQYNRFTHEVYELYKNEYSYKHYKDILSKIRDEDLQSLLIAKDAIDSIEKVPLSKLKSDIKKQIKEDNIF